MQLKPQDVVLLLKLCSYKSKRPPMSSIATDLGISPSEVHGGIKRLQAARLLHGPELESRPNVLALEEFLLHGLKYIFPAEHGPITRGIPTSYAAAPLNREILSSAELPPVWPLPEGNVRGIAFKPLYKTVPLAASKDSYLYELLALVDAIRDGRARERKIAEQEVVKRLRSLNAKP